MPLPSLTWTFLIEVFHNIKKKTKQKLHLFVCLLHLCFQRNLMNLGSEKWGETCPQSHTHTDFGWKRQSPPLPKQILSRGTCSLLSISSLQRLWSFWLPVSSPGEGENLPGDAPAAQAAGGESAGGRRPRTLDSKTWLDISCLLGSGGEPLKVASPKHAC